MSLLIYFSAASRFSGNPSCAAAPGSAKSVLLSPEQKPTNSICSNCSPDPLFGSFAVLLKSWLRGSSRICQKRSFLSRAETNQFYFFKAELVNPLPCA